MAEPTTSAVAATVATAGVGLASLMPWVDAGALMGAVLGAGLVAYTKKDIKPWQRLAALVFSAAIGYLLSPEVVHFASLSQTSTGAFIGSIVIVPLTVKLIDYVNKLDISTLLKRNGG